LAPVRILYGIDNLGLGGTETQLTGLIDRLDRARFEPHLVTLRRTDPGLIPARCPHLQLEVSRLYGVGATVQFWRLIRYLRRHRIQIVHTFFQDSTVFCTSAACLAGVPVRLASFRDLGFWRTPFRQFLMRRVYPRMSGFLANSSAVRDHFCRTDLLDPEAVRVIPNGIDPDAFPFQADPREPPAVGIVANLNRRVKRIDLFIEAAARVAAGRPDVVWHVVGDGQMRPEFEQQARSLGLGDRIRFVGRIADVSGYIGRLDVGVNCSDSEGFSNAVLEYMLRGCAVVATDVGGNSEMIESGKTGILVPRGDASALARAIEGLLADPADRVEMARRAREDIARRFNWDVTVGAHEELYAGFLGRR
jgi:glycosyltransferase involved in cell wall biosynthesis